MYVLANWTSQARWKLLGHLFDVENVSMEIFILVPGSGGEPYGDGGGGGGLIVNGKVHVSSDFYLLRLSVSQWVKVLD